MGMVWESYHKGVPLLGVPEITLDKWGVDQSYLYILTGWVVFSKYLLFFKNQIAGEMIQFEEQLQEKMISILP